MQNDQLIVIPDNVHEVHRQYEEEGLSFLLPSARRRCEEEGRGANPSSEVPGDEAEGHLENVRKRAGVQSLFLRSTRGRR